MSIGTLDLNTLRQALEARTLRERVILLGALIAIMVWLWLLLLADGMAQKKSAVEQQMQRVESQVSAQQARYRELSDPAAKSPVDEARSRISVLQNQVRQLDGHINDLGSQLIPPRKMAAVLASILRSETSLRLLSLENLPPRALLQGEAGSGQREKQKAASAAGKGSSSAQVYRHGLKMVFEGDYLETIRYLQSLETLDSKFFWEDLDFTLVESPVGKVTLNIYTLSRQQEWIGV